MVQKFIFCFGQLGQLGQLDCLGAWHDLSRQPSDNYGKRARPPQNSLQSANILRRKVILKSKTLCIDFDDTIRNSLDDLPINGVAEVLSKLQKKGYRIVISSARINVKMWGGISAF
jgi:phosphoglycolate phosphatase-like HAD superfamily hydrolase